MSRLQPRLLVVDDEPAMREVVSDVLASEGYEVFTAQDGLDALDRLVQPLPDVIISDLIMPRMSGFEFLAVVRERFPSVPVIAISGEFMGNQLPPGVLADAFLPKGGFTTDQLCGKINELMSAPPVRPSSGSIGVAH
ncbi:MAG: response regulator [Acidobacteriia bacterium]|nr:response regulator [Terriglobia bacterium]